MSLLDALRRGIDHYPGGRVSLRPRVDPAKSFLGGRAPREIRRRNRDR